jgi:hypothetical protein
MYVNGLRFVWPGVTCPTCGGQVVYNGNYFCENWTYPYEGVGCDWVLSYNERTGDAIGKKDKAV